MGSSSSHKESSGLSGPIGPSLKKPSSKASSPGLECQHTIFMVSNFDF